MALRSLPRALLRGSLCSPLPSHAVCSPLHSHARPRAPLAPRALRALATSSAGGDGPVYVVFGATGGIGAELARLLHASGGRVALVGRDQAKLDSLAASLPGAHAALCANAAAAGEADAAIAGVVERFGRVDGGYGD